MVRKRKTLEGSNADSRQRLVETASRLFRVQGYHATGLNQIVDESHAPKGSLYHYFPAGKEQLAGEALRSAGAQLQAKFREVMNLAPEVALDLLIERSIQELEESDYRDGCPIATVALETTTTMPGLREVCCAEIDAALSVIQSSLQKRGLTPAQAETAALTIFATFEGALLLCKVRRSPEPLRRVAGPIKLLMAGAGKQ